MRQLIGDTIGMDNKPLEFGPAIQQSFSETTLFPCTLELMKLGELCRTL
jgi:hypothetical protein